jgi:hypothetical protein
MTRNQVRVLSGFAAVVAVIFVVVPVLGVDPSPSAASLEATATATTAASVVPLASTSAVPAAPSPSASTATPAPDDKATTEDEDGKPGNGPKSDKADKDEKTQEHPVTLTGVVGRPADDHEEFTLIVGVKIYPLDAGPMWWWGDANPLAKAVGKSVRIDGEQAEGSGEIDVLAIDGKAIRAAGKPPWAGGWKVVGPKHPGWAQWKVDKQADKVHGRDTAPGQLKKDEAAPTP